MIGLLFLEQLLVMFVGLADTLVISYAGEAAVLVWNEAMLRLLLSYLLGITLQMGVIGIALAMVCDWNVLFIWRERTGKWKTFQVIES